MPTTSFSNTFAHATGASPGRVQADGFYSPSVAGQPTLSTTGGHSLGPAQFPAGIVMAVVTGITARAGGGQALATLLTAPVNIVTTVATTGDSVKLPAMPVIGQQIVVKNSGANSMNLFPNTGQTINGGAVNTQIAMAAAASLTLYYVAANTWLTV